MTSYFNIDHCSIHPLEFLRPSISSTYPASYFVLSFKTLVTSLQENTLTRLNIFSSIFTIFVPIRVLKYFSMPDISDVGPPAKGPGLPERIPDAKPPPVKVRIEHGMGCKEQEALKDDILKEIPEAQVELVVGADG